MTTRGGKRPPVLDTFEVLSRVFEMAEETFSIGETTMVDIRNVTEGG